MSSKAKHVIHFELICGKSIQYKMLNRMLWQKRRKVVWASEASKIVFAIYTSMQRRFLAQEKKKKWNVRKWNMRERIEECPEFAIQDSEGQRGSRRTFVPFRIRPDDKKSVRCSTTLYIWTICRRWNDSLGLPFQFNLWIVPTANLNLLNCSHIIE